MFDSAKTLRPKSIMLDFNILHLITNLSITLESYFKKIKIEALDYWPIRLVSSFLADNRRESRV
jgi:hypothetical protein